METMVLPNSIKYSTALKGLPSGISASRQDFLSEGNAYSNTNRIIRIPITGGPNDFLDTTRAALQFQMDITCGTSGLTVMDGSYFALFESARVLSARGGQVLEQVSNYGQTVNSLIYSEVDSSFYASNAANMGFPGGAVGVNGSNASLQTDYNTLNGAGFAVSTTNVATAASVIASLPVLGLGTLNLSSKAHGEGNGLLLPLAFGGVILELTIKSDLNSIFVASAGTGSPTGLNISNVKYRATVVKLPETIVGNMRNAIMAAGGKLPISSYTYNVQSFNVSGGSQTLNAGQRAKSIKSVYVFPRESGNQSVLARSKFTAAQQNPTKFQLVIGNKQYPEVYPVNAVEALEEFKMSMGGRLGDLIPAASYFTTTNNAAYVNGDVLALGYLGFDTESLKATEFLQAGFDNSTNSLPLQVVLNTGYANARVIDVAVLMDNILVWDIMNGTISASS